MHVSEEDVGGRKLLWVLIIISTQVPQKPHLNFSNSWSLMESTETRNSLHNHEGAVNVVENGVTDHENGVITSIMENGHGLVEIQSGMILKEVQGGVENGVTSQEVENGYAVKLLRVAQQHRTLLEIVCLSLVMVTAVDLLMLPIIFFYLPVTNVSQ